MATSPSWGLSIHVPLPTTPPQGDRKESADCQSIFDYQAPLTTDEAMLRNEEMANFHWECPISVQWLA